MDNPQFSSFTNEDYWNEAAKDWDNEILDNFEEDRNQIIRQKLEEYAEMMKSERKGANSKLTTVDFGCGVGKWLPHLSRVFDSTIGLDISKRACRIARKMCKDNGLKDVKVIHADLAHTDLWRKGIYSASFATCANVLISPDLKVRVNIIRQIRRTLQVGGILFMVVPSVESHVLIGKRRLDWLKGIKERGIKLSDIKTKKEPKVTPQDAQRGVFPISGVRTQHFRKKDLKNRLKELGFNVLEVHKVEYEWEGTLDEPTDFLGGPYPFDWLVVSRKVGLQPAGINHYGDHDGLHDVTGKELFRVF